MSTQVLSGYFGFGAGGLIFGHIAGQMAGFSELARTIRLRKVRRQLLMVRRSRLLLFAKRYARFPKYSTVAAFASSGSTLLPIVLLASMFGTEAAGFYLLANRTLLAPLTIFGGAIGQVFFSRTAGTKEKGQLGELTLSTFKHTFRLSLVPFFILFVFSPVIFAFVFGEPWGQAGIYAQWMIPWMLAQFCVSPLSNVTSVKEAQLGLLVSQSLFLVVRIASMYLGGKAWGLDGAIISYVVASAILYICHFGWILQLVRVSFRLFITTLMPEIILSFLGIVFVIALNLAGFI